MTGLLNLRPPKTLQKGIGTFGDPQNMMRMGLGDLRIIGVQFLVVCNITTPSFTSILRNLFHNSIGSAWRWDEHTQEYYLHLFCPEQPDLNWENPAVRAAVYDAMSFWLNKGVDGFRMDVINLISKVPSLPDAPVTLPGEPWQPGTQYYANGPRMHEFLHEMRKEVLDKYDTMTVGEMPWIKEPGEVLKAIGRDREELDMVFQFDMYGI
jgi:glycosidase